MHQEPSVFENLQDITALVTRVYCSARDSYLF